jgi:hypothetical protein
MKQVGARRDVETRVGKRERPGVGAHEAPAVGKGGNAGEHCGGGVDAERLVRARDALGECAQNGAGSRGDVEQTVG